MPDPRPLPADVSPLDTLARLIDLYAGCARAGILSDLGRADRANLEALRAVWAALQPHTDTYSVPEELAYAADDLEAWDNMPPGADTGHFSVWLRRLSAVLQPLIPDPRSGGPEAFGPNSAPNP